jgi:hypothetical protein
MRRLPWRSVLLLAPVLALVGLTVGCPNANTGGSGEGAGGGTEAVAPVKPKGEQKEFEAKGTGTLKGKATLEGPVPEKLIADKNRELESAIEKNADKEHCHKAPESEKTQQEWKVSGDGAVQNVVVFVRPPEGQFFKLDPEKMGLKNAEVKQPFCAFVPHVQTMFPSSFDPKTKKLKPTGQKLIIVNDAPMNHNTKWDAGPKNVSDNKTLPPGQKIELDFTADNRQPIKLSCNIHGWMNGYIWALDTPYAAVTNEKGEYEIKDVPAGADLQLFVWHEPDTMIAKGEKITIKEGDTTKDFKVPAPK